MPYEKLIKMKKFSKLRIKQLWDDCRICCAHATALQRGEIHYWKDTGKKMTWEDLAKRLGRARGLLIALGFSIPVRKKKKGLIPIAGKKKAAKELYRLSWPYIKKYYHYYRNRVERA